MAVKIDKYRVDDKVLQEDPQAQVRADRTVKWSLGGDEYEIDLTDANFAEMVRDLDPWKKASRRTRRSRRQRRHLPGIRDWARSQGYDVKPSGRIAESIVAEYEAAVSAA